MGAGSFVTSEEGLHRNLGKRHYSHTNVPTGGSGVATEKHCNFLKLSNFSPETWQKFNGNYTHFDDESHPAMLSQRVDYVPYYKSNLTNYSKGFLTRKTMFSKME